MKKILFLFILLGTGLTTCAQDLSDLFSRSDMKITWLGIDFSHVKLVGDYSEYAEEGKNGVHQIQHVYFPAWNDMIKKDGLKFDIDRAFRKRDIHRDIEMINWVNKRAVVDEMECENCPDYSENDIQEFVNSYQIEYGEGLGLVMITGCMDACREVATFHFVVFNMMNKEILLQEIFETSPQGPGRMYYWAASYYNVFALIRDEYYDNWKKRYGFPEKG